MPRPECLCGWRVRIRRHLARLQGGALDRCGLRHASEYDLHRRASAAQEVLPGLQRAAQVPCNRREMLSASGRSRRNLPETLATILPAILAGLLRPTDHFHYQIFANDAPAPRDL